MNTHDDLALRSCLDLAVQMLAIRRELQDLRQRVDSMATVPRPGPMAIVRRVTGWLSIASRFFETKLGQAILAIAGPGIAWLVKWLLGIS